MKYLVFFAILILAAATLIGQDVSRLQTSPSGKRALTYFDAINSGDDQKLTAFFAENTDEAALKRRPVAPRVEFHKRVRGDFAKLELRKVVSVSEEAIVILAQSPSGEWASLTFEIEGPSGKFAGVSVERIPPPSDKPEKVISAPTTEAEAIAAAENLFSGLESAGTFSGVAMIADGDKILLAKAYGFSNVERKVKNDVDTRFNLGSMNKLMTRIALGQLMKQGKISFSDKLIKVLPDYPNREVASKITVGQIVTMSSGLGDFFNEKFDAADKAKIRELKDYLQFFVDKPLLFEPGTGNSYSNAGYLVLGLIIEKLSGKNYYDYIRENIFKPLGMSNSGWFAIDALPPNTATGYKKESGHLVPNVKTLPARGSSAGGGYSTVGDLLKLSSAIRNRKVVVPDDTGVFPAEASATGIAGGSPGANAIFLVMPRTGYTVIVLSNLDPPSAEGPGTKLRDWLRSIK